MKNEIQSKCGAGGKLKDLRAHVSLAENDIEALNFM
jgi:hypothetical protein